MEVLRSNGLSEISFALPTAFPSQQFTCLITDSMSSSSFEVVATTDSGGQITITLPNYYKKYDGQFEVTLADEDDDELVSYGVSLLRPYCEPVTAANKLGISVEDATEYERVARLVIDSVTGGFGRYRTIKTVVGMGSDYLPMHDRITKIYSLKENTETLEVGTYSISDDQSAIVMADEENRVEYRPVWNTRYYNISFPEGFDYTLDADFGWQTIPSAIQEAALLLIQDISCGNNKFLNSYVQQYQTDGYNIKYANGIFGTTGNSTVDKILSTFANSNRSLRVRIL